MERGVSRDRERDRDCECRKVPYRRDAGPHPTKASSKAGFDAISYQVRAAVRKRFESDRKSDAAFRREARTINPAWPAEASRVARNASSDPHMGPVWDFRHESR